MKDGTVNFCTLKASANSGDSVETNNRPTISSRSSIKGAGSLSSYFPMLNAARLVKKSRSGSVDCCVGLFVWSMVLLLGVELVVMVLF